MTSTKNPPRPASASAAINPLIFRAYDIRGIAGKDLTEDSIYLIGKATGIYLQKKYRTKTMAVGCDNRPSSEKLKRAYIKGLIEAGLKVTDIGLAVSPMIYWAVCAHQNTDYPNFDAGTNITASHNPKEYNGLKIVSKNAHSVCGDELQEIFKLTTASKSAEGSAKATTRPPTVTKASVENIWPKYLKDLLSRFKPKRKLKVVVDAGNGTAGKFAPEFLRKLGCEVIKLYCELDGTFPNHEANPEEPKNMADLISTVKKNRADLGIGFDGDGDRIGVVDEKGKFYASDFMLLLLARDLLTRSKKAKIVFDIKVSQAIINEMQKYGAVTIMSKTGHSFIESKMKEVKASLGGEVSGHLFFAENYYGFDDAFYATGKIIEILSNETHPLSQMFSTLPKTYATPEIKLPCPDDQKFRIVKNLIAYFTKHYDCITIDGVRINFDKNSWGAVRASNTSPNLTLRFEADSQKKLKDIKQIMLTELKKYPEINTENF